MQEKTHQPRLALFDMLMVNPYGVDRPPPQPVEPEAVRGEAQAPPTTHTPM